MNKIEKLLDRVNVFNDSKEVVQALINFADELEASRDYYYCYDVREAATHIEGLWLLTRQMAKELKRVNQATSPGPSP